MPQSEVGAQFDALNEGVLIVTCNFRYIQVEFKLMSAEVSSPTL